MPRSTGARSRRQICRRGEGMFPFGHATGFVLHLVPRMLLTCVPNKCGEHVIHVVLSKCVLGLWLMLLLNLR